MVERRKKVNVCKTTSRFTNLLVNYALMLGKLSLVQETRKLCTKGFHLHKQLHRQKAPK